MNPGFVAATLTSALVALKLTGVIGWNWWIVFLPELVYVAVALTVIASARWLVERWISKLDEEQLAALSNPATLDRVLRGDE